MSASVFLIDPERASDAKVGNEVILDGPEGRHAVAVQRIRVGETVHLVDGRGRRIVGSVEELTATDLRQMEPGDVFVIETPGGGGFGSDG